MRSKTLWAAACLLASAAGAQEGPVAETIAALAERYGVSKDVLAGLRDEGMGWGEIGRLVAIAEKTGRPLEEIARLRRAGEGFNGIAERYKIGLGDIRRVAVEIEQEGRRAERLEPDREGGRRRVP